MKDRFLFKAKRIDNGEWIIGFLTFHKTGKAFIKLIFGDARSSEEVDPSTICQCTGLKDMNGNLIWENDIIKDNVIYGVVRWEGVNARYIIDDRDDGYQDYSEWWQECEVIGNIFDNPELLEGGE